MIAAVIPTRYHPPELELLLNVLHDDDVAVCLMESEDYDHAIYRMWNVGVHEARCLGCNDVAILNDDVGLEPGTLPFLARALRSEPDIGVVYPDVRATKGLPPGLRLEDTRGTWGAGGMTGFAFMFRADAALPRFDEGYHWWYADDAFEAAVRAEAYRVCRVIGVPVRHVPNGSAGRDWARLSPLIDADRARWEARA